MSEVALRSRATDSVDGSRRHSRPRTWATARRHALGVWCAATTIALVAGAPGIPTALLLAVSFAVVPGAFVVDLAAPRGPVERLVITWSVSLTCWMLAAHVQLTVQWWEPRAVAGVMMALATAAAAARAYRRRDHLHLARSRPVVPDRTQIASSIAAVALWAVSLPLIDTDDIGDWGLITSLPPTFYAAYAIAIVIAVRAATAAVTSVHRVAVAIAPLLVMIYGTLAVLVDTIRYPWSYKHVGVIRLLDETGRLHPDVDIYNNFSGFFGLGAMLRGASGIDPTSYAAWSQLVAEALILAAVWLLVRRATDSERVAHLASVLYLLTNWVGQNYFAAQTLATLLSLSVLGLVASWFFGGATRDLPFMSARLRTIAPRPASPDVFATGVRRAIVLLVFLGLMMTHPLTPVATLGAVTLAWVIGWVRDRWIVGGIYLVALGWALRSISYFAAQSFDLGFGGSPTENADGNLDYSAAPDAVVAVGNITRLFSVGVWVLAIVGALLCAWAMRRTGMLLVAAAIPFGIPLVQSYGGEAIYRVYLYSLPLIVAFIAWGIVTRAPIARGSGPTFHTVLAAVVCIGLGTGFLVAHFGRERINNVERSEVAMGDHIATTLADPAVLAQFDGTYPAASSARYPSFQVNDTYVPYIVEMVGADGRMPTAEQLDEVADDLFGLDAGTPYVIVSPGMIDSVRQVGSIPVASTSEAVELLTTNPRYVVSHRIDDTWLLEVLP